MDEKNFLENGREKIGKFKTIPIFAIPNEKKQFLKTLRK